MVNINNLPTILADIDLSKVTGKTDSQVEAMIELIAHYGLYVMVAVVVTTIISMGVNSKRGGDVNITPLVVEFVIIGLLIGLKAAGVSWLGI